MTFELTPEEARYILTLIMARPISEALPLAQKWQTQMNPQQKMPLPEGVTRMPLSSD